MRDCEAWIGECHLRKMNGEEYRCLAAVWARYESFRATLEAHVARLGYSLIWLEEILPAPQYLPRHGSQHRQAEALAQAIHPGHTVELGPMHSMGATGNVEPKSYLMIEEIEGVEPLDLQVGVHPRKTVPDALIEPILGQPEPTAAEIAHYGSVENVPPLKTYAILDAAKMPSLLTSQLDNSGLRYQSLFQGKAQEELKEYAPYLVDLEDGNDFTRKLFTTDKAMGLWEKELGIFVRSRVGFEELRKHFRKFTRVQDENGKWFYFRFWEAPVSTRLILDGNDDSVIPFVAPLLNIRENMLSVVILSGKRHTSLCLSEAGKQVGGRWVMTPVIWEHMRQIGREQQFEDVMDIAWRNVSSHVETSEAEVKTRLLNKRDMWLQIGFWRRDHFAKLCAWEAILGPDFLETYANGKMREIIYNSRAPHEAISGIEKILNEQIDVQDQALSKNKAPI